MSHIPEEIHVVSRGSVPVVSIYQNPDHVAGLVQQLFNAPLITESIQENVGDTTNSINVEGGVSIATQANVKVPLLGNAGLKGDVSGAGSTGQIVATGTRSTQSFVYSQAYYLNIVRKELQARSLLKRVDSIDDAEHLQSGDFVEYQATFAPSELTTIMDVMTPDLVGQITRWLHVKKETALFEGYDSIELVKRAAVTMNERAEVNAGLARDVVKALQADFRQDKTREYYGNIVSGDRSLTAITICDNAHFVVDDEDRILDGVFTVLGKVTSSPEENVPVLQRNKLLRNLSPDGVDTVINQVTGMIQGQTSTTVGGLKIDNLLDLKLASRVAGTSIRVVPIAIFV
ncbi:hypothetical protein QMG83_01690 [Salinibacterium sp. G-O1]|uniref:DUF6414 family protein n=1 Tax=Salinibacterium sp. G-O1 TaxID=3046208 RepID=UPI0024BBA4CF|nr:hypothetical protein [Salinibacterium sp. G-O1]MDJ0333927.1 hypothetical protein [Salinibacterium sp. G-O1]